MTFSLLVAGYGDVFRCTKGLGFLGVIGLALRVLNFTPQASKFETK